MRKKLLVLVVTLLLLVVSVAFVGAQEEIIVGLITKTETNPFFVKMREGAQAKADELGVTLLTAAGSFDGDNAAQVTAIENMVAAGAKGILLVASDTTAIVPAIQAAREQGVIVIALDTPMNPEDATDALYATDNFKAGVLIGQWAAAKLGDDASSAQIALLNLNPGITVGDLRRDGFLEGFGITLDSEQVVCQQDTQGDQALGQTAMENCLAANPDINLVYTINEPAAFGAYRAIEDAGRENDVTIVSVDGGCAGVSGVLDGRIDATSQQYPLLMASLGVENIVRAASGEEFVQGYTDTGVALITADPQEGIDSEGPVFGVESCWGEAIAGDLERAQELEAALGSSAEATMDFSGMDITVGLITKTETNPFFVKMREGAQAKADELGVTLLTAAGSFDGDNAAQVTAIENMVAAGAKGILLVASDTTAIVPAIQAAREQGVIVIALDTPMNPEDATDALYATDNFKAGVLIGQWAAAKLGADASSAQIALLNLNPGITVGDLRRDGFLEGFGITLDSAQVVCQQDTQGDQALGQTAMENCLAANPDINLVYTINEPAAFGAYRAIEDAGRENDVTIVSVDGGCAGVSGVLDGRIDATSQQYPLLMASLGVENIVRAASGEEFVQGYTDTGVALITADPQEGIDSEGPVFGVESCWGEAIAGDLERAQELEAALGSSAEATMDFSGMDITVGLITKTETNPFFVKMREGAQAKADELGVTLLTAAGSFDGDNAAQVTAIENMVAAGAKGILLVASDTTAIVPAIQAAREQGVIVIALDTPMNPVDATDALYATDNFKAGVLIGQWAAAKLGADASSAQIALLNLNPGITVGDLRRDGFLEGFGITLDSAQVVCQQDTQGDQALGQTAMENCLAANPDINLVYTINEPAAFGAYRAIEDAGRENDVTIVSVDGGCAGVRGVESGQIDATSQQYPLLMASLGVENIARAAAGEEFVQGYTDTGVTLITDEAQEGIESIDSATGLELCWGE